MKKTSFQIRSSRGKFEIRSYETGDEEKILSSWETVFGRSMPAAHWQWKYPLNPAGFRTLLCLSENGEVAVHYAGQGCRVCFFGKEVLGLQLTDIFTHPAYRWAIGGKTGLFIKTARIFWQTFLEKAPFSPEYELKVSASKALFLWGLPGHRHARLGQKMLSYDTLPRAFYAVKPPTKCKPGRKRLWLIEKAVPGLDPLPSGLNELWKRFRRKYNPFCLAKDAAYLSWRFWQRPLDCRKPELTLTNTTSPRYRFYFLKRPWSLKIRAWLVTTIEKEGILILDFLAEQPEMLTKLLIFLLSEYGDNSLRVWTSETSPWKRAFLDAGFVEQEESLGIVPSIQGFEDGFMEKKETFHWIMGDADLF